jgi:imidazoleglycerol phosphate dehydratase HisB
LRVGSSDLKLGAAKASANIDLDGSGKAKSSSGSAFLDHMLSAFSRTAQVDLETLVDSRSFHRAALLGRAIGLAINEALKERSGIRRYGSAATPMDESLAEVALDFSGRPYLIFKGEFSGQAIGDMDVQEIRIFMESFVDGARLTLHMKFYGENDHHKAESIFKALGLALREAVMKDGTGVPSTKGII